MAVYPIAPATPGAMNRGGPREARRAPLPARSRRPRVGLALSSGGARGLAHIGVIQVLERYGIGIDAVAGSSMGAYVGSLYAYGCSGDRLEELAAEMRRKRDLLRLLDPVWLPRQGFLRGSHVKRRLRRVLGDARFSDLVRPLSVIATNVNTHERAVFRRGSVAEAVHASLAIPGICVPVEIDGQSYSDGGIVDPLPVGVLRDMGCDRVIAVSVVPSFAELEARRAAAPAHGSDDRGALRRLAGWCNRSFNLWAPGNMMDILRKSVLSAEIRLARYAGHRADVLLHPSLHQSAWHDYQNYHRYITAGRKVAEENLERLFLLTEADTSADFILNKALCIQTP